MQAGALKEYAQVEVGIVCWTFPENILRQKNHQSQALQCEIQILGGAHMKIQYIDRGQAEPLPVCEAVDDSLQAFLETMQVEKETPERGVAMTTNTCAGDTVNRAVTWYARIGILD